MKLNSFVNQNPYGSQVGSVCFVNEENRSLLIVASGNWTNY